MERTDFRTAFFGDRSRGFGANELREKWMKMTDEEKLEFMNKKMEGVGDESNERGGFFGRERGFSVEAFDSLCEKWMKMSTEEKEAFIKEREEHVKSRMSGMGNPFGERGRGFGFGFGR